MRIAQIQYGGKKMDVFALQITRLNRSPYKIKSCGSSTDMLTKSINGTD